MHTLCIEMITFIFKTICDKLKHKRYSVYMDLNPFTCDNAIKIQPSYNYLCMMQSH